MKLVLAAILVLLVVAIAYLVYARYLRLGPPADCSDYPEGVLRYTCDEGVKACGVLGGYQKRACDAAVGACMPVARDMYDYMQFGESSKEEGASLFNRLTPHLPACAEAVKRVDPESAVKVLEEMGVPLEVPSEMAPFFEDRETRKNIQGVADMVPDSVEWLLDFGDDVITANTSSANSTKSAFLGNKAECYADMDCGPAGYCMAEFPNDPTFGGHCAPA
jgi:hypothetical protein